MTRLLAIAAALLALSACTTTTRTPVYDCPLDELAGAKCASVEDAYHASRSMNKDGHERVQSVFDPRVQQAKRAAADQPFFEGRLSGYPDTSPEGKPVFAQPKVMRVWIAPYVDADGNLRSGEYTYFSTPGQWNYGTLKKPGAASSSTFGPGRPDNLGFTPGLISTGRGRTAQPMRPPEPAANAAAAAQRQGATPAPQSAADNSGGITQPYERLSP